MASMVFTKFFYDEALGLVDWDTHEIKAALIDNTYTASKTGDSTWATGHDPYDSEITGTGYTAGGDTLLNASVSVSGDTVFIDGDTVTWNGTITARGVVLYNNSHASKDLVAWFEFDSDKSSNSGNFVVSWNAAGLVAQCYE